MSEQTVETDETAEQQTEEQQEEHTETEAEVKARDMGWKPAEDWDGDESKHLTAEEFVNRNDRLKRRGDDILKADNARMRKQMGDMQTTLNDLVGYTKKADSRARQKALDEIRAEQRLAVEDGDTVAFDRAAGKMDALADDVATEPAKPASNPDEDPDFVTWAQDNDWYGPDGEPDMTLYAEQAAAVVGRKYQGEEFYREIEKRVRTKFPDHFKTPENTNRRKAQAVEGTGNTKTAAKTLWDEVPKDDRAAFTRFVEQGLYENTKEGREKYADVYLNG